MDIKLQRLKRDFTADPNLETAQRYIASMERAVGGVPSSCEGCPYLFQERYYTSDSWELVYQWYCEKTTRPRPERSSGVTGVANSSRIGWEEDGKKPERTPDWCPLMPQNKLQTTQEAV